MNEQLVEQSHKLENLTYRKEPSSLWTWMVAMIVKQLVKLGKLLIHSQYIVRAVVEKSSLTIVCLKLNPNKILVR